MLQAITSANQANQQSEDVRSESFRLWWPRLENKLKEIESGSCGAVTAAPEVHPVSRLSKSRGSDAAQGDPLLGGLPSELIDKVESAEASEAIGDVWSAMYTYGDLVKELRAGGFEKQAEEMERRRRINTSAAAEMNRGDGS
jgi:hypothetical protein